MKPKANIFINHLSQEKPKNFMGKRTTLIFVLVIINSLIMYYANYFRSLGGGFSQGFLVGWLFGIVFCLSLTILGLFIHLIYKEVTTRWKEKK